MRGPQPKPHDRQNGAETILKAFPQARSLWQIPSSRLRPFTLEAIGLGARVLIVQTFDGRSGWTVYTDTTPPRVDDTLEAIAEHCGVSKP